MLAKRSASRSLGLEPPSSDLSKGKENFRRSVAGSMDGECYPAGNENEIGFRVYFCREDLVSMWLAVCALDLGLCEKQSLRSKSAYV